MHSIPRWFLAICINFPVFVRILHLTIEPISMIHWVSPLLLLLYSLCMRFVVCVAFKMKYRLCNDLEMFYCYEWPAVLLLLTEIVGIVFIHDFVVIAIFVVVLWSILSFSFSFDWVFDAPQLIRRSMDDCINICKYACMYVLVYRWVRRSLLQRDTVVSSPSPPKLVCLVENFYYPLVVVNICCFCMGLLRWLSR